MTGSSDTTGGRQSNNANPTHAQLGRRSHASRAHGGHPRGTDPACTGDTSPAMATTPPSPSPLRRAFDAFNRRFARFHTRVYRATGGWLGHRMTGAVTSLLLTTTGRRTGQPRSVA